MNCLAIFFSSLLISSSVSASVAHTAKEGSAERRAILDALRPSVESKLGNNVKFLIKEIKSHQGWAFVSALPRRKNGQKIDWRGYFATSEFGKMDGLDVTAVLKFKRGRWNLIDSATGATDAWYGETGPHRIHTYC